MRQIKGSFSGNRITLLTILLLITLSWYYMLFSMTMNMSPIDQWQVYDFVMLFVMWSVMMVGMMLPSATPVILLINKVNKQRQQSRSAYTHTLYFIVGYLLAWILYSLLISFVQFQLHTYSLLSSMMVSQNSLFTGILLIITGIYQWSSFKQKCLQLCRSPMNVLSTKWQEGIVGAIKLGFYHGQYCLGCCWFLMMLLFATGVMNLKWILILTLLVMMEKLLAKGALFGKVLGILLVFSGVSVLFGIPLIVV